jgi:hypothetical protein
MLRAETVCYLSAFGKRTSRERRERVHLASMAHGGHGPGRYPAVQQSLTMQLDVEPTVCDARKMVQ